jgi:hypothetical protein
MTTLEVKTLSRNAAFRRNHRILAICLTFGLLTIPTPVFAALGGDTNSVQADQVHMQGSLRSARAQNYTIHEIQAPTGTTVREYISPSGTVFAVAWKGPWPPDMRQLLGEYFDQYAQAAEVQSNARTGRRPLHIELPGLVVHVGGHLRSFAGTAYLPDRLPHGVRAEELR